MEARWCCPGSNTCGAAIAAGIVRGFHAAIWIEYHGTRVPHHIRIGLTKDFNVVTGGLELLDQTRVKA